MNITITIQTDDVASKLKQMKETQTSPMRDMVSPKVIEMMDLLKRRLNQHNEPTGG